MFQIEYVCMYVCGCAYRSACNTDRSNSRHVEDMDLGSELSDWHMNMLRLLLVCMYVCMYVWFECYFISYIR